MGDIEGTFEADLGGLVTAKRELFVVAVAVVVIVIVAVVVTVVAVAAMSRHCRGNTRHTAGRRRRQYCRCRRGACSAIDRGRRWRQARRYRHCTGAAPRRRGEVERVGEGATGAGGPLARLVGVVVGRRGGTEGLEIAVFAGEDRDVEERAVAVELDSRAEK